jgi:transcriptional regulator with XRE-family HTH domain
MDIDTFTAPSAIDRQIGERLKNLRAERGWSLDELAKKSGVSRATLSRLENAEVSATTSVLGKLCTAYDMPMSRLMRLMEEGYTPLVVRGDQPVWVDPETGFRRRQVSPPSKHLKGEVLDCILKAGTRIAYAAPPCMGLEHHLVMQEGQLGLTVDGRIHQLKPGDCLRYQTFGPTTFETPKNSGAHYLLFVV